MARSKKTNLLKLTLVAVAAMLAAFLLAVVKVEPSQAAFPGQNGKLVFSSSLTTAEGVDNPEGDYEIFAINPDGTNLTQLTRNATDDFYPDWSPDGTKIAYQGYDGSDYEIFTMSLGGGTPTNVTDNAKPDQQPAWSPDGSKIAYVSDDYGGFFHPEGDIYTVSATGGPPTKVTDDVESSFDRYPEWSPDGSQIAFSAECWGCEGFSRIRIVNPDGSASPSDVTQNSSVWQEGLPDWSPDGSQIAFTGNSQEPDFQEIYAVSAAGGTPVALTDTPTKWEDSPAWSPDGSKIAFTAGSLVNAIWTVPAGGGTPTNVTNGLAIGGVRGLDWQPLPTNTAPTITSLRPPPGSSTTDRTPSIAATVTDQQTNLAKSNITLLLDDVTISRTAFSYNHSTDRMTYTPEKKLSFGKHALKVIAEDGTGLSTTKRWSFAIVHP